jgi:hypothetical protein
MQIYSNACQLLGPLVLFQRKRRTRPAHDADQDIKATIKWHILFTERLFKINVLCRLGIADYYRVNDNSGRNKDCFVHCACCTYYKVRDISDRGVAWYTKKCIRCADAKYKIQKLYTCVRLKMSDLAIFREKHTFYFKDFTCNKKKYRICYLYIYPQAFGIVFFFRPSCCDNNSRSSKYNCRKSCDSWLLSTI